MSFYLNKNDFINLIRKKLRKEDSIEFSEDDEKLKILINYHNKMGIYTGITEWWSLDKTKALITYVEIRDDILIKKLILPFSEIM